MRRSSIGKTLAANRSRKMMPGVKGMSALPSMKSSPATAIPGGIAAPMKKGGTAKKPKMGIAIMVAIGKKKAR
jgi:hypothetical protein